MAWFFCGFPGIRFQVFSYLRLIFQISIPAPFFRHTCPADYAIDLTTSVKNMQKEISLSKQAPGFSPALDSIHEYRIRTNLYRIFDYLNETGKVCPKPWYWKRFFIIYKPRYEPCWLSSWWETSVKEKKELFHKQLRYLAYHTDHFHEACQFLYAIDKNNWYYQ